MLPSSIQSRDSGPATWRGWPWLVILGLFAITAMAMRLEGQPWWCDKGDWAIWISDVWTTHCSQHIADPYTITHMSHGLIFWGAMVLLARLSPKLAVPERWRLSVAVAIAAAWEILENTPYVINRYRNVTMSLDYLGDSIANSLGDVGACMLGFIIAKKLGWKWTISIFVVTEIVLLFAMRDNLTLNVVMLLCPVDAIKQWQQTGH